VEESASDLFFSSGTVPHIKIEGITMPLKAPVLQAQDTKLRIKLTQPVAMAGEHLEATIEKPTRPASTLANLPPSH
jgi:Tfp pilus assembly ATPase PilU